MLDTLLSPDGELDDRDSHIERCREWFNIAPMVASVESVTGGLSTFLGLPRSGHQPSFSRCFVCQVHCILTAMMPRPVVTHNHFATSYCGGNITQWSLAEKERLLQSFLDLHGGCVAGILQAFERCSLTWKCDAAGVANDQSSSATGTGVVLAGFGREESSSKEQAVAARSDFAAYERETVSKAIYAWIACRFL